MRCLLLAAAIAASVASSSAKAFDALVTACHDGDTCTVTVSAERQRIHVRLHGVDTLELDQPFGVAARAMTSRLIVGRHVDVREVGRSHDRLVADLVRDDGADVAVMLVSAGMAWVDPRYSTDATAPARQAEAQHRHAGLWADPSAIAPWDWRRAQRQSLR